MSGGSCVAVQVTTTVENNGAGGYDVTPNTRNDRADARDTTTNGRTSHTHAYRKCLLGVGG